MEFLPKMFRKLSCHPPSLKIHVNQYSECDPASNLKRDTNKMQIHAVCTTPYTSRPERRVQGNGSDCLHLDREDEQLDLSSDLAQ